MQRRRVRGGVALLLAPALALRLFIPDGFMASSGDGATLTMQMCHGDARSAAVMRLTGGEPAPADHGTNHEAPCVFAASAAAAPPPLPVVPLAAAAPPEPLSTPRIAAPEPRNTHRPQSPRAPPSLV